MKNQSVRYFTKFEIHALICNGISSATKKTLSRGFVQCLYVSNTIKTVNGRVDNTENIVLIIDESRRTLALLYLLLNSSITTTIENSPITIEEEKANRNRATVFIVEI